jgi:DNA-binding transcriptional MerR regulator
MPSSASRSPTTARGTRPSSIRRCRHLPPGDCAQVSWPDSPVSVDTLRHYELKGLLPKTSRLPNGYREYAPEASVRVRLVRRAVALGFTLDELTRILAVRDRGGAPCRSVRALAHSKLAALEERIAELIDARDVLQKALRHWDVLLERTPTGRAGLLDALEDLIETDAPSPLLPAALQRKRLAPPARRRST